VASIDGARTGFVDLGREVWRQSIYEVRAVYGNSVVASAPFAITSELSENLIANGGFEQDGNAYWDKWFTGEIPWQNMSTSSENPHGGERSMEIRLENYGSNSSIVQWSHYGTPEDYIPVEPGTFYSFGGFIRSGGLSVNSEHWFEWDSPRTAENTNARPSLPYPNYFTPALRSTTAPTEWTYQNRVFSVPEGFPNVQLRHRFTTEGRASGSVFLDDVFFRPLPHPEGGLWQHWIALGSDWRYLVGVAPANWFSENFNDELWLEGRAKFGEGGGPKDIVTAVTKYLPAYFFRKTFVATAGAREMILAATCTDDYAGKTYPMRIWLNGTELATSGIDAVSGEGNILKYFDLAPFIPLIKPGANVIAVMLQNTWQPTWDNIAFDISVRAIPQPIRGDDKNAEEIDSRDLADKD
jgi:hypothetical protein